VYEKGIEIAKEFLGDLFDAESFAEERVYTVTSATLGEIY
jgi:hypothetical protein